MKTSVTAYNFLDNSQLVEDIFHELKSIVSSILSSVELIELYDGKSAAGKITRQAEAIKSQVIELEFQLQNVRIIQHILSNSFELNKRVTSINFFLKHFVNDEPYNALLASAVELPVNGGPGDVIIDELIIRQLVLNLFFWMNRNSSTHQLPRLIFSYAENYFEIKGYFFANYIFSSPFKSLTQENRLTDSDLLNQPVCYLMSYMASLHGGSFDVNVMVEPEKSVAVSIKIPYRPGLL